jgi:hypothetical protein
MPVYVDVRSVLSFHLYVEKEVTMGILVLTLAIGVAMLIMGIVIRNPKNDDGERNLGTSLIVFSIILLIICAGVTIDHLATTTYRISQEKSDQYYYDLAKELNTQTGVEFKYWNRELVGTYEYKFTVCTYWDKATGTHFFEVRISQVKHYDDEQVGPDIMYSADDVETLSAIIKKFAKVGETYESDQVN